MCNLYRMTSNVDAMRQLFGPLDTGGANVPPLEEIYPEALAPVIVAESAASGAFRRLETMRWGWPPFGEIRRPITNVRNLASPMWRHAIADRARRCLVPVTAFSEWSQTPDPATGRKRKHWFALTSGTPFAFAGLWRPTAEGPRFAFLTCAANELVGAIHPKAMPVMLPHGEPCARWLSADGPDAAAMQVPYDADLMVELDATAPPPPPPPAPAQQGSLF